MEVALLFVSTVIAGVGLWLAWNARDTSHRQLRAYLIVEDSYFAARAAGPGAIIVEMGAQIRNYGQTPAFNVTVARKGKVAAECDELPDFASLTPPEQRLSETIVGPGGTFLIPTFTATINADQLRDLQKGTIRAYLWAQIDYQDAFTSRRHTTVHLRSERQAREDFWPTAPCRQGNTAT